MSIEPHAYRADVFTKIVNGHPNSQIDDLLPWAYLAPVTLRDVAREQRLQRVADVDISFISHQLPIPQGSQGSDCGRYVVASPVYAYLGLLAASLQA
jgi:hypothetical protein